MAWESIALIVFAYVLGSVCAAIVVSKVMGLEDPRDIGSKNPGATNMLRVGGKKAAAITLAADMIKGMIPVAIGKFLAMDDLTLMLTTIAVVFGHVCSCFLRFRGGKGVATAIGACVVLTWQVGLAVVATWLFVAKVMRISSLSALVAWSLAPAYCYWLAPEFIWAVIVVAVIVIVRHHTNIRRLLLVRRRRGMVLER